MTPYELLASVQNRGARLVVIDGRLKVTPPGCLPPELKSEVVKRAAEIKALLLPHPDDPAYSLLSTCQRYGVALRIDPRSGDLVVGRAGAKADETTQPWASLLFALEAHTAAVGALVRAGWMLHADFPKSGVST